MNKNTFLKNIYEAQELIIIGPCPFNMSHSINKDAPILVIDGGLNHDLRLLSPNVAFSIGDNDSNSSAHELDLSFPKKKDKSDLALGLELICTSKIKKISLYGFLGGRLDHEYANFGELVHFAQTSPGLERIKLEDKVLILPRGEHNLEHIGLFSLFTTLDNIIRLTGQCSYTLKNDTNLKPFSSHGLSNKACGKFKLCCNHAILLFFNNEE